MTPFGILCKPCFLKFKIFFIKIIFSLYFLSLFAAMISGPSSLLPCLVAFEAGFHTELKAFSFSSSRYFIDCQCFSHIFFPD